jgi:hypothetical protein
MTLDDISPEVESLRRLPVHVGGRAADGAAVFPGHPLLLDERHVRLRVVDVDSVAGRLVEHAAVRQAPDNVLGRRLALEPIFCKYFSRKNEESVGESDSKYVQPFMQNNCLHLLLRKNVDFFTEFWQKSPKVWITLTHGADYINNLFRSYYTNKTLKVSKILFYQKMK